MVGSPFIKSARDNQPDAMNVVERERQIMHQPNKESASGALTDWIQKADVAGVAMLKILSMHETRKDAFAG